MDPSGARAEQAALNNALWCDAVCRAGGVPGAFYESLWLNLQRVPPFYPNAVTLTASGAAEQLARIDALAAARRSFSVKDSFAALDLTPVGMELLFEATWLWRDGGLPAPLPSGVAWAMVTGPAELDRWEAAWAGLPAGQPVDANERIFHPSLLVEPGVFLLSGMRDGEVVAVAAASLSGKVAGVSNVFSAQLPAADCYAGVVGWLAGRFPSLPLVGYERGEDLAAARSAGFKEIGPLRVWAKED